MEKEKRNNNKRNLIFVSISLIVVISLTISVMVYTRMQILRNGETLSDAASADYVYHFAMITQDRKQEFWQSVYKGAKAEGDKKGAYVELIGSDLSINYSEEQLMDIAIASDVDGIILEANESQDLRDKIRDASQKGIPVITVMHDCMQSKRTSFVGISSYTLGQEYASEIRDIVKKKNDGSIGKGKNNGEKYQVLVLLDSDATDTSQNIVYTAIQEAINADRTVASLIKMDAMSITSEGEFEAEEAIRNLFLSQDTKPDIIICLSEINSSCVYQAIVDFNQVGNVEMVGYYTTSAMLSGISKKIVNSTAAIDTTQMGQLGVNALIEYLTTGYASDYYSVDSSFVTFDNISEYLGGIENE